MEALVLTATASTTTKVVRDYKRSNLEWWLAADGLLPVDIATCFRRGVCDRCWKCGTPTGTFRLIQITRASVASVKMD
jgi:hypothetical protein